MLSLDGNREHSSGAGKVPAAIGMAAAASDFGTFTIAFAVRAAIFGLVGWNARADGIGAFLGVGHTCPLFDPFGSCVPTAFPEIPWTVENCGWRNFLEGKSTRQLRFWSIHSRKCYGASLANTRPVRGPSIARKRGVRPEVAKRCIFPHRAIGLEPRRLSPRVWVSGALEPWVWSAGEARGGFAARGSSAQFFPVPSARPLVYLEM
jgi:hypothetical protein